MANNAIPLSLGVFILITALASYSITNSSSTYFCEKTQLIGECSKLSSPNSLNISTNCYYNGTKYSPCSTGWKLITTQGNTTIIKTLNTTLIKNDYYVISVTQYPGINNSRIMKCEITK